MTRRHVDHIGDVLHALRLLPQSIVQDAAGGQEDLGNFLWFSTNIFTFAERLVSTAGLAAMAIYVDELLRSSGAAERDRLIENYLRTMLLDRGYGLGLACSIVQRCCVLTSGPLAGMIQEHRAITGLITARHADPGNLVRSQLHDPPEAQLASLVRSIRFLRDFTFVAKDGASCVSFRRRELELRPFLFWDGRALWHFRRVMPEDEEKDHILYVSAATGDERREPVRMDSRVRKRVDEVARLLDLDELLNEGTPADEAPAQSVIPLFAESYPNMNDLVQKIYEKTTLDTRFKLWVRPLLGDDYKHARARLRDEVYVTNAIIKQCMDRDPVSVMEDYFVLEPGDPAEYFALLEKDAGKRRKLLQEIEKAVADYRNSLSPFYRRLEHQEQLQRLVDSYRARLVAQKVVRLFGFPMLENLAQDGLEDHWRRVDAFRRYLASGWDDVELHKELERIREGILACSRTAETVLRTILLFYNSLRWYRPDHPESLDESGISDLNGLKAKLMGKGFGSLSQMVQQLNDDQEVRERVQNLLGRESLWPENLRRKRVFAALNELKEWRNMHAHEQPASIEKAQKLVEGLLDFLDWLMKPVSRVGPDLRIFPALLSLNVVTRNSCGISSIKYTLVSHDSERQITLYTKQPLSISSGSFFGLPHLNTSIKDLWMNPVLIPSGLFHRSGAREPNRV